MKKVGSVLEFSTSSKLMLMLLGTTGLATEILEKYMTENLENKASNILGSSSHTLPCLP